METLTLALLTGVLWASAGILLCAIDGTCHLPNQGAKLRQLLAYLLLWPLLAIRLWWDR